MLPDFFFDRIITFGDDITSFSLKISKIAKQKGGNLDGISQEDIKGGNAINTAFALAALEAKVAPIVCVNDEGIKKISSDIKQCNIDLSHLKKIKNPSITSALEFKVKNKKVNIMLRDLGSLANFQSSHLNMKDYEIIQDADYVCLFNWAGTRKYGTQLAQDIFLRVKTNGRGKTYYDTADPNSNAKNISELVNKVLTEDFIDILSLNENEAISYASFFDRKIKGKNETVDSEVSLNAARILAKKLNARIDLHTSKFSATITKKKEFCVRTFKIKPKKVTGAGDAWNAGNIIADMNSLSDISRLILANALSACYLSDSKNMYPTKKPLIEFIQKEYRNSLLFA